MEKQKTRVFLSYNFCRDALFREFIIGQTKCRGAQFTVAYHSMNYITSLHRPERALEQAMQSIDVIMVAINSNSHRAGNVLTEVSMAQVLGKPVVQVGGYQNKQCLGLTSIDGEVIEWDLGKVNKAIDAAVHCRCSTKKSVNAHTSSQIESIASCNSQPG